VRVPLYRQLLEPQAAIAARQVPDVGAPADLFGHLGRMADRLARELAAEVEARDRTRLEALYAEARRFAAEQATTLLEDPREGAAERFRQSLDGWLEQVAEDPETQRVLPELRRRLEAVRIGFLPKIRAAELAAVRRRRTAELRRWLAEAENAAYTDPTAAPEMLAKAEELTRSLPVAPEERDRLLSEARRRVARAALIRRLEKAPDEVLGLVQRGEGVAAFLEVGDRERLAASARTTLERRAREAELARLAAEREARKAAEKARRDAARALEERIRDELARRADGVSVPKPLTLDDFLAASDDPGKAREAWATFRAEAEVRDAVAMVRGAPPAELAALLDRHRPDPQAPDYAASKRRFELLQKAIRQDMRERAADPLGYALRTDPELAGELDALLRGKADAEQVFADLDAAQERLGIPPDRRRLLPEAVANQLVGRITSAETVDQKLAALAVVARVPARWRAEVEGELFDAGLPKTMVPAVEALRDGEPERARLLLGLGDYKPRLDRDTAHELDALLRESELGRELERAAVVAGAAGDAHPLVRAHGLLELARKAAAMRIEAGADLEDAVADAVKTVLGRRRPVVSESAAVSIPADLDPDAAATALEGMKAHAFAGLDPDTLRGLVDAAFGDVPDGELRRNMARAVLSDLAQAARWVDDGEGGYRLVVPVPDATGAITWRAIPHVRATPDDLRAAVVQGLEPITPPEVFVP